MTDTREQLIPQGHLREIFEYRDGVLFWKYDSRRLKQWNTRYAGKKAGWDGNLGYTNIYFVARESNGLSRDRNIARHRLVYCFFHGHYPPQVDHINGNRGDDRIENLRAATATQNCANRRKMNNNTTGCPGVRLHCDGHYEARVQFAGKRHNVGFFRTLEEARIAIVAASKKIKGEWHRSEEVCHY